MATNSPIELSDIPADLITAVIQQADRDAEMVFHFLNALRNSPAGDLLDGKSQLLTREFLMGLAGAMTLLAWETENIYIHREAGMPSAHDALVEVSKGLVDPSAAANATQLALNVHRLSIDRLCWAGRSELQADITIGKVDEDLLLEALADFVWAHHKN